MTSAWPASSTIVRISQVLVGDRLGRVDHHDAHLGALDRGLGAQRRVVLVPGRLLDPPAQAGGVDEPVDLAAERRPARRPGRRWCRRRCRRPSAAGRRACSAATTCRRSACRRWRPGAGPPDLARTVSPGASGRASRTASSRSPRAAAVQRGDRVRLPQPEVPHRGRPRPRCAGRRPCWRPARPASSTAAQHPDDGLVLVGDADGGVHDEQDGVRGVDRHLGLLGDLRRPCPWRRDAQPPVSTMTNSRPFQLAS